MEQPKTPVLPMDGYLDPDFRAFQQSALKALMKLKEK